MKSSNFDRFYYYNLVSRIAYNKFLGCNSFYSGLLCNSYLEMTFILLFIDIIFYYTSSKCDSKIYP